MNTTEHTVFDKENASPLGETKSAFYIGKVFHKRLSPKVHQFTYPLYMMFLDLDELAMLHDKYWWFSTRRWAPLQLKASDYLTSFIGSSDDYPKMNLRDVNDNNNSLGNHASSHLKSAAISIARSLGGNVDRIDRVCMLAQLRSFGLYFSPVNFFFLYENSTAKYLLAEVSNTPWNKKHCYLVDLRNPIETPKEFHVSPFMDLDMVYRWSITPPDNTALVHIENWNTDRLFTAIFSADRYEINRRNTRKIFLQWPVVTATIVKNIYWQAIKLSIKGIRYVPYQIRKRS
ncbi:MAG: DUF1365 family protein [Flavobacteriales bacterium]|jgi:DUF1365 family protein